MTSTTPPADEDAGPGMAPTALAGFVSGFLSARGYQVEAPEPGLFLGRSPERAEPAAALAPQAADGSESPDPARIEHLLAAARDAGVRGRIPVVATSRRGLGPADLKRLSSDGASVLFPLQFADWYFRADQSGEEEDAAGIDARLREAIDHDLIKARAPQPFRRLASLEQSGAGQPDSRDLFGLLAPEMARFPDRARLRVISGAAGVGKTVLVTALLKNLHDSFNAAKRRANALASRPLLFQPDDLGSRTPETLEQLIEQLYATDLAAHVPPAAFQWLATEGFNTWIFDGLDEFYRRQNGFFEALEQMLDAAGSRAQIVICTRDSLFSSSERLVAFLQSRLARAPESTEIYELSRWDAAAKRAFITVRLIEDGVKDAALERRTEELASQLQATPSLAELTDLPFYCSLFVAALQDGRAEALRDEFALLQSAVDALIAREAGKLSIEWDVFVSSSEAEAVQAMAADAEKRGLSGSGANLFAETLRQYGQDNLEFLLGGAAHFYRFASSDGRALAEVSVEEWREVLSPSYVDADLDEETEERVRLALMQFAFFGRGRGESDESGRPTETMSFVHELIADYLAAKYALSLIESGPQRPEAWRQALGQRADIEDTVFFRYLKARLAEAPEFAQAGRQHLQHPIMVEPARAHLAALLG